MPEREWPSFSALHLWQKGLIGLVFGVVLMVLLLLPNRLGSYITAAAAVAGFVGLWIGFRVGVSNLQRPEALARLALLVASASIVSMIAVGLIALSSQHAWVLWFWTASEALAVMAWMLFVLRRSLPRVEDPLQ